MSRFNEDTRVKIPGLVHATRLGYNYISLKKDNKLDEETNIFKDIFKKSISKINDKKFTDFEIDGLVNELKLIFLFRLLQYHFQVVLTF